MQACHAYIQQPLAAHPMPVQGQLRFAGYRQITGAAAEHQHLAERLPRRRGIPEAEAAGIGMKLELIEERST